MKHVTELSIPNEALGIRSPGSLSWHIRSYRSTMFQGIAQAQRRTQDLTIGIADTHFETESTAIIFANSNALFNVRPNDIVESSNDALSIQVPCAITYANTSLVDGWRHCHRDQACTKRQPAASIQVLVSSSNGFERQRSLRLMKQYIETCPGCSGRLAKIQYHLYRAARRWCNFREGLYVLGENFVYLSPKNVYLWLDPSLLW